MYRYMYMSVLTWDHGGAPYIRVVLLGGGGGAA